MHLCNLYTVVNSENCSVRKSYTTMCKSGAVYNHTDDGDVQKVMNEGR